MDCVDTIRIFYLMFPQYDDVLKLLISRGLDVNARISHEFYNYPKAVIQLLRSGLKIRKGQLPTFDNPYVTEIVSRYPLIQVMLALRSIEIKRLGCRTSIKRLPRELEVFLIV